MLIWTGTLHRPILCQRRKHHPGLAEPDVLHLPADDHLRPAHPADAAAVRHAAGAVRGARAAVKGVLVEGVHAGQHLCRDSVELSHGAPDLRVLVLSHRPVSECGADGGGARAGSADVFAAVGLFAVRVHVCGGVHCRHRVGREWGEYCGACVFADAGVFGVSALYTIRLEEFLSVLTLVSLTLHILYFFLYLFLSSLLTCFRVKCAGEPRRDA